MVGLTRCDERSDRDRCFIAGHDPNTGKQLWKFVTVALKRMPGGDTWGDLPDDKSAGADAWIAGTFDPEITLTSEEQAKPSLSRRDERGTNADALFSNTTLALYPDTGQN